MTPSDLFAPEEEPLPVWCHIHLFLYHSPELRDGGQLGHSQHGSLATIHPPHFHVHLNDFLNEL